MIGFRRLFLRLVGSFPIPIDSGRAGSVFLLGESPANAPFGGVLARLSVTWSSPSTGLASGGANFAVVVHPGTHPEREEDLGVPSGGESVS
jgi:hypothetical protein